MRAFLEQYGIAIFIIIILGIMTLMANGLGLEVKKKLSEEVNRFTQSAKTENTTAQNNSGYDGLYGTVGGENEEKPGHVLISGPEFNELILTSTTSIEFLNTSAPTGIETIDVSEAQDGSVLAWYEGTNFYIAPKETGHVMYANPDSSEMFDCSRYDGEDYMLETEIVNANFDNLNTSKVTNMEGMFRYLGTTTNDGICTVSGLEALDTSNATNMRFMFYGTFFYTDKEVQLNLSNWNTSNVTTMEGMFAYFACWADKVEIIGLEDLDVSNVTNMRFMFEQFASSSTNFNLDLSKWGTKTGNVETTYSMFNEAGITSETFYLNLSNWDMSNVTRMDNMFARAGRSSTTLNIVGLDNWDVSNVEDMGSMFNGTGRDASTWAIGYLSNWDVSSVINMSRMFDSAGKNANYKLNISTWNTAISSKPYNFKTGVESKIISPWD